eukprot:IDg3462t1
MHMRTRFNYPMTIGYGLMSSVGGELGEMEELLSSGLR